MYIWARSVFKIDSKKCERILYSQIQLGRSYFSKNCHTLKSKNPVSLQKKHLFKKKKTLWDRDCHVFSPNNFYDSVF